MPTVLLLGAYGMLGSSLAPHLAGAGYCVFRQGRRASAQVCVDPLDEEALARAIADCQPDSIVNLAAATDVDQCEMDPQCAFLANVRLVESVVRAARSGKRGSRAHLVHISTDQVYDGPGPHREEDGRPCNVYGLSKYAGEFAAAANGATVLRTNFFGRSQCEDRLSLSDWVVNELRAGVRIKGFDDVVFSPLHVSTLCRVIERTLEQRIAGIFNAGSRDGASKAEFALRLGRLLGLDSQLIQPCSVQLMHFRARRPLDMRLDSAAFENAFGIEMGSFDEEIQLAAKEYRLE
jgi:dTDP-4-dehydrorhamnose reductase